MQIIDIRKTVSAALDKLFGPAPTPRRRVSASPRRPVMSCAGPACIVPATCPRCPTYQMAMGMKRHGVPHAISVDPGKDFSASV